MRNSQSWNQFVEGRIHEHPTSIHVDRCSSSVLSLSFPPPEKESFLLSLVEIDEEGLELRQRSGDPSQMIASLDASMRRTREEDPTCALTAYLKPQNYWTRGQAWQLGEYLAERDLLLWIDLTHLHPERAVAWVRFAVDMGLTCPRTFMAIPPRIELDDLPLLMETGTWLIQKKEPGEEGRLYQA